MENKELKYTVCTEGSDYNFPYLRVMLLSLLKHNPWAGDSITILTCDETPLSEHNRAILNSICGNITYRDIDSKVYQNIKIKESEKRDILPLLYKIEAFNLAENDAVIYINSFSLCISSLDFIFKSSSSIAVADTGHAARSTKNPNQMVTVSEFNTSIMLISKEVLAKNIFSKIIGRLSDTRNINPILLDSKIRDSLMLEQIDIGYLPLNRIIKKSKFTDSKFSKFLAVKKNISLISLDIGVNQRVKSQAAFMYKKMDSLWQSYNQQGEWYTESKDQRLAKDYVSSYLERRNVKTQKLTTITSNADNTTHGDGPKMTISFNMATMPQRIRTAVKAIDSVYNQADVIRLYLNNFDEVPEEFKRDKIEVYQGEDLKSTGKLFWAKNPNEYYFCIDDDIDYPPTYVKDMIATLNSYNDNAIVSCHGKILKNGIKTNYFKDLIQSFHCLKKVENNTDVHVIGNGVSVFNTNKFKVDYTKFKYHYMDDIMVSIQAQEQRIRAVVMKHPEGYLKNLFPDGFTLYEVHHKKPTTQNEMVNSINWNFITDVEDYTLVIPSYNRYNMLVDLINQINTLKGNRKINILVIDDCSTDNRYNEIQYLENVTYHRNKKNNGKFNFYKTINTAFDYIRTLKSNHILFLGDDIRLSLNFFNSIDSISSKYRNKIINYATYHNKKCKNWGFDHWVDGGFYINYDILEKIGAHINEIPQDRFKKNPDISSGVWQQFTKRLNSLSIDVFHTQYSLILHLGHTESAMHSDLRKEKNKPLITNNFIDYHKNVDIYKELSNDLEIKNTKNDFKFMVLVPVHERYDVLRLFSDGINSLRNKGYDIDVLAVGSSDTDKNNCLSLGFNYINHRNILGEKLNVALKYSKRFNFDAMLMLGSDDILNSEVLDHYTKEFKKGSNFVGFIDCYFYDLEKSTLLKWNGYTTNRVGEPIGAWRCFKRSLIEELNWVLWGNQTKSIDATMWEKIKDRSDVSISRLSESMFICDLKTSRNVTKFTIFDNSKLANIEKLNLLNDSDLVQKIINYRNGK